MKRRTVGELLERYMALRERLLWEEGEAMRREVADLKSRLVTNYAPLVKYVAGTVAARSLSSVDREDLFSWGITGLLEALDSYRSGRGATFETYAISKIRWAILDNLRREDWRPRALAEQARNFEHAYSRLSQRLRRHPRDEEVAEEMGMEFGEYRRFLERNSRAYLASLEAKMGAEGEVTLKDILPDASAGDPLDEAQLSERRMRLAQEIRHLEERERTIITLYFYEGLTLREIGRAIELSEGRVSQLLRRSLSALHTRLLELEPL